MSEPYKGPERRNKHPHVKQAERSMMGKLLDFLTGRWFWPVVIVALIIYTVWLFGFR